MKRIRGGIEAMLTREYLRFRRRNHQWYLVMIDAAAPVFLELAESLLEIYREGVAEHRRRGEIEEPVEALTRAGLDPVLAGAFDKLIQDNCTFEPARELDYPAARRTLFEAGGKLLGEELPEGEYGRRMDVLAKELFGDADLYGDLPENERLAGMEPMSAEGLTARYNLAQAQGLLMYASSLKVVLPNPEASELRRLFKFMKFFRLLAEVRQAGDTVTMEVSGPFSILENSRKYGMQLATFFPAVVLMKRFRVEAEVVWKGVTGTLVLDETTGLKSHYRNFSSYVPEEIAMFHKLFREKVTEWTIVGEAPFLETGEGRLAFPDLSFEAKKGKRRIHLELFHRWHKVELARRLEMLEKKPGIKLLLGIDRSLVDDEAYAKLEQEHPKLAGRMFRFRDFPGVERVKKMLDAYPKGK